ncbi:MAG: mycofactocin biosynthesis chaperone MftB [Actinomycetota bacterium]
MTATAFDADRAYRLHEQVALRPEPFGALAYHYGNRRLNFLRAKELVTLVESLDGEISVRSAFDTAGIDPRRWPSFEKALAALARSNFLVLPERAAA